MSNERCFVFRVNYSDSFELIHSELTKGILRQGWGAKGMRIDAPVEHFISAWKDHWPDDFSGDSSEARSMKRKYNNLHIMTEIQVGDLIIIPKLSMEHDYVDRFFTIARCDMTYDFSLPEGYDDFGVRAGVLNQADVSEGVDLVDQVEVCFLGHLLGLGFETLRFLVLLVQGLFTGLQVIQFFVKCLFALVHPALKPRNLVAAVTNFFTQAAKLRCGGHELLYQAPTSSG